MNNLNILDSLLAQLTQLNAQKTPPQEIIPQLDDIIHELRPEILINDTDKALKTSQLLLNVAQKIDYAKGIAMGYSGLGFASYMRSNHEAAMQYHLQSLEICREINFRQGEGSALNGIAGSHLSLGNFDQAFDYALKSLQICRDIKNEKMEGWCLHGLGIGYYEFGDHETSLKYFQDSLNLFKKIDYPIGIARALTGIGTAYLKTGNFENAEDYFNHSLELYRETENLMGESRALSDLGLIYMHTGDYKKSFQFHQESLAIRKRIGNPQSETTSLFNLGLLFFEQKDFDAALSYFKETLELAGKIKIKPRIYQTHQYLAKLYEIRKSFESALYHQKAYSSLREEVLGDENNTKLRNLAVTHKLEQSEREAELVRLQNEKLNQKNSELETVINQLKDTQAKLIQTEKMAAQGKLVAGLLHEINTPVGTILSTTDVLKRGVAKIGQMQDLRHLKEMRAIISSLPALDRASTRLNQQIQNLKGFIQLDESNFKRYQLLDGLKATINLLETELGEQVKIETDFAEIPEIYCFAAEINQVFLNILSNAISAVEGDGHIKITAGNTMDEIIIEVEDNGIGISAEQQQHLFEPRFSSDTERIKAGFGLFTSLNIIKKHGGNISVNSEEGKGSTFSIHLPTKVNLPSTS